MDCFVVPPRNDGGGRVGGGESGVGRLVRLVVNVYDDNILDMIDWKLISGFDWDEGNARKSVERHDVSQSEAEEVFFNQPILVLTDGKHSQTESRFHLLGMTDDGRRLHITFTLRSDNTLIRVISARDMHRKERAVYEQNQKDS